MFIYKAKLLPLGCLIKQSNDQHSYLQHLCDVICIFINHFEPFFISSWLLSVSILPWDSELRIISRLRFSLDGTEISEKSLWGFNPRSEKTVICPALLRLLLSWSHQTQFKTEDPLQLRPNRAMEGRGWTPSRVKGRVGGLTGASGSALCQIVTHQDFTGPITAVQFLLPTVGFLYLYFDAFRLTLNTEKPGLCLGFLRF